MKYRHNKIKKEHHMIDGASAWLEDLSRMSMVTDIIPGVIEVTNSRERGVAYQYETKTGCKLLMKNSGAVQEVFVVTPHPQAVLEWVSKLNEDQSGERGPSAKQLTNRKPKENKDGLLLEEKEPSYRSVLQRGIPENYRLVEINRKLRDSYVDSLASMADGSAPPLEEAMAPELIEALTKLKASLGEKRKK